jgi:Flp pilus assembly protein TadG
MGLGLLAMTVDLGQLFVAKNELQNIADAAALAGARKLIQAKDPANPGAAAVYSDEAIAAAKAVASDNKSFGQTLTIADADVVLGQWDLTTSSFTKTGPSTNPLDVNSIQVTVRRDGSENPSLTTFFGGIFGSPTMNSQATAVAYLGLAGTAASGTMGLPYAVSSTAASGAYPGVANYPVRPRPYARSNPMVDWLMPKPAYAATQSFTWKDLGGSTLNANKGTFIMPNSSERTDLSQLQRYIKGPNAGGDKYPKSGTIQVGQKVYPISEYQWPSNVYDNFTYLKTRFNSEKAANGKWRTTVAVYYTNNPTAMAPTPPNTWLGLAQSLLGPKPAYACMSYTSPVSYVEGFVTVDVTSVTCNSTCKNYSYPDSRSCYNTCSMNLDIPGDNFVTPGSNSNPVTGQSSQQMNPNAGNNVGSFAAVPYLVK